MVEVVVGGRTDTGPPISIDDTVRWVTKLNCPGNVDKFAEAKRTCSIIADSLTAIRIMHIE